MNPNPPQKGSGTWSLLEALQSGGVSVGVQAFSQLKSK